MHFTKNNSLFIGCCLLLIFGLTSKSNPFESKPDRSGFSIVQDENKRFWIKDPDGEKILSIGVNHIVEAHNFRPPPETTYYDAVKEIFDGDVNQWKESVLSILKDSNFNTIGCWSTPALNDCGLYETVILYLAGHEKDKCYKGFDPDFETEADKIARDVASRYSEQEMIMGIFLDNEMPWFGLTPWTDQANFTLLENALSFDETHFAHLAGKKFIKTRYRSLVGFEDAWGIEIGSWDKISPKLLQRSRTEQAMKDRDDFIELAAEKYFSVAAKISKKYFPGSLNLGVRFAGTAPVPVIKVCGKYCDVISVNDYRFGKPDMIHLATYWVNGQKPLMITEYSWRGKENKSGNPNTGGAGSVVPTQQDRADRNTAYLEELFQYPMLVGAHWFEFSDQSPQGRFDGENSNYGVVSIKHERYGTLLTAMKEINSKVHMIHSSTTRPIPIEIPEPESVKFAIGQYPDRPPVLNILELFKHNFWHASDANMELVDTANKATIDGFRFKVNTGTTGWGCGIDIEGPLSQLTENKIAHDWDGYSQIEIELELPQDWNYYVFLNEGAAAFLSTEQERLYSDDGESFTSHGLYSDGNRSTITLRLDRDTFNRRTVYGNQEGKNKVDLTSMRSVALYFPQGQGEGQITLFKVQFKK